MEVVEFWFLIPIKKKPKTYGFLIFKIVKIKFETKGKKLANSNTHSRPAKITHLRLFLDFEGSYMCMEIIGLAQRPIIKPLGGDENILLHQHMYIVLLPCEENLWQRFQSPFDGLVCKCKTSSNFYFDNFFHMFHYMVFINLDVDLQLREKKCKLQLPCDVLLV